MKTAHVKGKKVKKVLLYALSTCIWCKKTRELLDELGVDYDYVYVDLAEESDEKKDKEISKWNPELSFPIVVIDDKECIIGYKPEKIREKIGL
ncbi:MAG: glutaredoxin family protein [Elusimicrobia bacterium]|nr:glutaredoxin family protein [Elusimicrobiota bacterium]